MNYIGFLVFVLFISKVRWQVGGYRILGVFPVPSKSHYYIGHALMAGLANDGHAVTVISPFRLNKPISNYTEVFLENSMRLFEHGN